MRAQGLVAEPIGVGAADHVCWVYEDPDSLAIAAGDFLAGGLTRGERLLYVGDDDGIARLRRVRGPIGAVDDQVSRGVLALLPLDRAYGGEGRFEPERQLAFYDIATRTALADGYRGLRVVAELTPLAADPGRRAELVRWEHLADGFMASGSGMSALCAYRHGTLPADVLTEVGTVHPQVHAPREVFGEDEVVPFRVYVDGDRVAVAGSVDAFGADRLRRVLTTSPVAGAGVVTLDLGALDFADAAGCRAIASWAEDGIRRGSRVRLVGASPMFHRVWQLLGYGDVVTLAPRSEAP